MLATVLFTDIVGSTERAAEMGDHSWKELLERHHQVVRAMLGRYRGVEVTTAGDGFFATFDGPARAVRCAQAIVAARRTAGDRNPCGRTHRRDRIHGRQRRRHGRPHRCPGRCDRRASEVVVSSTVHDLVVGSGLTFEEHGVHALKGVPGTWHLFLATPS